MQALFRKPNYRLNEFCRAYAVGRSKAYGEIAAGRLKVFKIGKNTCVTDEDAQAWLSIYRNCKTAEA